MWFCIGLLWLLAAFVVFDVAHVTIFESAFGQNKQSQTVVVDQTDGLRYTSLGWQHPEEFLPQPQQGGSINLGSVSPLVWAGMLVFAVGIAVMLLSSDDEVERIFHERLEKAEMIAKWESEKQTSR